MGEMLLWIIFAAMAVIAVLAVGAPIARGRQGTAGGRDVEVYKDQLAEIDRDRERGILTDDEAETARLEVKRRLLHAVETEDRSASVGRLPSRAVLAGLALAIPAVALGVYLSFGSPNLPGQPLAARMVDDPSGQSVEALIARVEQHLRENPGDGRGWEVLAPVYLSAGRADDAVLAWTRAMRILGPTPDREASYGEALIQQADGVITGAAREAFERALASEPRHDKSRFYLAIAAEQDGDMQAARDRWADMLDGAPVDAPWRPEVETRLARAEAALSGASIAGPGPSAEEVEAARAMATEDRIAMIRGMVAGLEERLADEGGSIDEWIRLIRSYAVLEDRVAARAALDRARTAYADDSDALNQLGEAAAAFGLEG